MVNEVIDNINEATVYLEDIIDTIVNKCCEDLDLVMNEILNLIKDYSNPITDEELCYYINLLPNIIYFINSKCENVALKEDIAKLVRQSSTMKNKEGQTGNATERLTKAEILAHNEVKAHICFQRAYKLIKAKLDAAYEQLNSLKKVLSLRQGEMSLATNSRG